MPISLKKLQSMTDTAEIFFHGEVAEVVYRVGAITAESFDDITAAIEAAGDDGHSEVDLLIAKIVESWDVESEPGKMLPIVDGDGAPAPELAALPIPFKSVVLTAIMEHSAEKNEKSGRRSRRGSLRRAR